MQKENGFICRGEENVAPDFEKTLDKQKLL